MRILIETEEKTTLTPDVGTVLPNTTPTASAGGEAPADNAVSSQLTPESGSATDAGGPPSWLIDAIGTAPATTSGMTVSAAGTDGGQAPAVD
ncbi:hypothetical protein [Spirosoma sp. 209]|uniref:hypothetical protein n=1 Tax=Spirosoma sp. 209 TaxID=1955701 RepID=UPI00098D1B48|nr:hypothetical protein [Spirosoma sp. 209]